MDVSTGHRLWGLIIRHPAVGCEHQVNTSTAVFNSFQYLNLVCICLHYVAIFSKIFPHMPFTNSSTHVHV